MSRTICLNKYHHSKRQANTNTTQKDNKVIQTAAKRNRLVCDLFCAHGSTYLVGVVVRVANHMVHPVWLRRANGTNGCLLLDSFTSAGGKKEK